MKEEMIKTTVHHMTLELQFLMVDQIFANDLDPNSQPEFSHIKPMFEELCSREFDPLLASHLIELYPKAEESLRVYYGSLCGAVERGVIEFVETGDVSYGEYEYQDYLQLRQAILEDDAETFMAILDDLILNS
jgi:hypothetical protein